MPVTAVQTKRKSAHQRMQELRKANIGEPIGGIRARVDTVTLPEPGWYTHWFIDSDDDRRRAESLGYEPVLQAELDEAMSSLSEEYVIRQGGKGPDGQQCTMILMKVPEVYYRERKDREAHARGGAEHMYSMIEGQLPKQNSIGDVTAPLDPNKPVFNPAGSDTRTIT